MGSLASAPASFPYRLSLPGCRICGQPGRRGDRPQGSGRTLRTGPRSPTWLKHKQPLRLPIGVLEGSGEIVRWGDRGWATPVTLAYAHRRTGIATTIDEIVRLPHPKDFTLRRVGAGEIRCWGILLRGRLRHREWFRWTSPAMVHRDDTTGAGTRALALSTPPGSGYARLVLRIAATREIDTADVRPNRGDRRGVPPPLQ